MDDEPALDLKKLKDSFQWQDDFRRFQNSRAELAEGRYIIPPYVIGDVHVTVL